MTQLDPKLPPDRALRYGPDRPQMSNSIPLLMLFPLPECLFHPPLPMSPETLCQPSTPHRADPSPLLLSPPPYSLSWAHCLPIKISIPDICYVSRATCDRGTVVIPFADGEMEAQCLVSDDPSSPSELSISRAGKLLALGWRSTTSVSLMCLLLRAQ